MKRNFPDKPLGEPIKSFDETFSAQTILLDEFFPRIEDRDGDRKETSSASVIRSYDDVEAKTPRTVEAWEKAGERVHVQGKTQD